MIDDAGFRRRLAAALRGAANDLKRDEEATAAELGLSRAAVDALFSGEVKVVWPLLEHVASCWPVNERDLVPMRDDTFRGVVVTTSEASAASSRVLSRGGVDYYEYRDTAMSRLATFRPEWIRMLVVVAGEDPDDPALRWNDGHLLYQFTYVVGPVNYYYLDGSERRCVALDTGDTIWGRPFGPHTFASRSATEPASILALTYGAELSGDALHELAARGPSAAAALAWPGERQRIQAAILQSFVAATASSLEWLSGATGLATDDLAALLDAERLPTALELEALAGALRVPVRELLPLECDAGLVPLVQRRCDAVEWSLPSSAAPDYRVARLIGDRFHPHVNGLEVEVLAAGEDEPHQLVTHQHQYLYVLDGSVLCRWRQGGERHAEPFEAGDSLYFAPMVETSFVRTDPDVVPRLLVLRIAGSVTPEARVAIGALDTAGLARLTLEDRRWYRDEVAL